MKTSLRSSRLITVAPLLIVLFGFRLVAQTPQLPATKNQLVVIAHRGAHKEVPENTVAAIEAAIRSGADYVELDLRTTSDGSLVLLHDKTVDRVTAGKGEIHNLTLNEVKALKVKPVIPSDRKDYRIPEFSEALKACHNKINLYLDFKDADVSTTWNQLREYGMDKQVVVYVNSVDQYKKWRNMAPQVPLMASVPEQVKSAELLNFYFSQVKIEVLDQLPDSAMVAVARKNGVAVWQDVQSPQEGPEVWIKALQKGVQGLQTDDPEALVRYLKTNKLRDGLAANPASAPASRPEYIKLLNVRYGDAEDPDNRFDAFVPHNHDEKTKVIVYLHGGSWIRGDKDEFPKQLIDEWVGKKGYALVSMNYRLVKDGKNLFPSQMEDVKKALGKITSNARKLKYDGSQFALVGASAGAHLALLYAYGYDPSRQVKTVINLWGAADLTDASVRQEGSDANRTVIRFLGETDPKAKISFEASPSHHLTAQTGIPTISFHGVKDPLIHVSQAENLHKKLISLGVTSQLELYPDEKHGISPAAALDVFSKIGAWLDKYYPAR